MTHSIDVLITESSTCILQWAVSVPVDWMEDPTDDDEVNDLALEIIEAAGVQPEIVKIFNDGGTVFGRADA